MDLVDRYLQAIKWWLPAAQKEDIITELREDLRSQLEEKREELGRDLTEGEISDIVKRRGRPVVVAGRYLPQQHLIGPAVYPLYRAVMKAVAFFYLVPWVVAWLGLVVLFPGYRNAHPGAALLKTWTSFWEFALVAFGAVTAVFAAIERARPGHGPLESWDPRKLSLVRDARRIPRAGSLIEMALCIFSAAWWADLPQGFPIAGVLDRAGIRWAAGSVWADFHARLYWPVLVVLVFSFLVSATNFLRPYWTRQRLALRAAGNLAGAAMLIVVLAPHRLSVLAEAAALRARGPAAHDAAFATAVTDIVIFTVLVAAILVCVGQAGYDLYRFWRLPRAAPGARLSAGPATLPG